MMELTEEHIKMEIISDEIDYKSDKLKGTMQPIKHLINDMRELCVLYISREDIEVQLDSIINTQLLI